MEKYVEQTLDSREVAEMVEKEHKKLLRDIRRYINQLNQSNIGPVDFFRESDYEDSKGETRPCYRITKKGCEFIAHKLTGIKGTAFTARYINRFHEMKQIISDQAAVQKKTEPERPWFIKVFDNRYIMLFRDFKEITGIELSVNYTSLKRKEYLVGGMDWNACGWETDNVWFRSKFGFDFGEGPILEYLYPCGILKAIQLIHKEGGGRRAPRGAAEMLRQAIDYTMVTTENTQKKEAAVQPAPVIHIDIAIDKS